MQLPFKQPGPMQPAPALRRLQAQGPVHAVRTAVGDPAWLIVGYEEVRRLLDDDRLGRAHPAPETAARAFESALFGKPLGNFDTEEADHARMRSLLQPHFSPRRMGALRGYVETLTAGLLDDLAESGAPADLHAALALPLPIAVICELLGVPGADRAQFRAWTRAVGDITDRARSEQGLAELFDYGRRLVARKRAAGLTDEGVIGRLAATEGVSDDEAATLGMFLLFAGYETTAVAIELGMLWLLANPEQWKMLVADQTLTDAAVNEIMRATNQGGVGVIPRYARTDIQVAGVEIRAGDLVVLDTGAANHDAAVFPDPDRFDISRRAATHLNFGHGARYCLGAPLARIELQVVFSQLAARFPTLRLDTPLEELAFNPHLLAGGLTALPVAW